MLKASEDQEQRLYKNLSVIMLQDKLLPHQRKDPTYQIRYNKEGDVVVSWSQRSWRWNMLRKVISSKHVAFCMLKHGVAELFDAPLRK